MIIDTRGNQSEKRVQVYTLELSNEFRKKNIIIKVNTCSYCKEFGYIYVCGTHFSWQSYQTTKVTRRKNNCNNVVQSYI